MRGIDFSKIVGHLSHALLGSLRYPGIVVHSWVHPRYPGKGEKYMLEKKRLTIDAIESQNAIALPRRNMLALINVLITNVSILNNNTVTVTVQNNKVAVQVCAAVNAINTIIAPASLTCSIGQ